MKNVATQLKQRISVSFFQAIQIFLSLAGNKFAGVVLFTEQVLVGGKSSYAIFGGKVYKLANYVFVVKRSYDGNVVGTAEELGLNAELWKPQPHNYATHIGGNLLTHNEDMHLPLESAERRNYAQFVLHEGCQMNAQYFDAEMRPLEFSQVAPYLPNKSSKKQSDLGIAKADQVKVINPSIKSIQSFSANGVVYDIVAE